MAQLSRFYHWPPAGPGSASALTGTELAWWLEAANRIVEKGSG
jgi:hypothetical protein